MTIEAKACPEQWQNKRRNFDNDSLLTEGVING